MYSIGSLFRGVKGLGVNVMISYFWIWLGLVFCKLISLRVKVFDRGVDYGRFKRF